MRIHEIGGFDDRPSITFWFLEFLIKRGWKTVFGVG
jgi:hypothetical protein